MSTLLAEILPLALVVTLSPLNIIPSILLLFSERPLRTASMFLVGFLVGVGAVLATLAVIAGVVDVRQGSGHAPAAAAVKVVLGVSLLVAAARKFRGRPQLGEEGELPGWMDGLTAFSPARAFVAGAALGAANPKNVVVGVAAALALSAAGLTGTQAVIVGAIYVVVAGLGVAVPIVAVLVLGDRSAGVLDGWKSWLRRNNSTVMAVLFTVFGLVLVGQGLAGA